MENLTTILTNPNFLGIAAAVFVVALLVIWAVSDRYFKNDRRLFELRRELRDDRQIREHLLSRLYNLEDRVDRLEDPLGKRKRGAGIYAWDRHEAIPGLEALEYAEPRLVNVQGANNKAYPKFVFLPDPAQTQDYYLLGPDGELRKEDAHD